MDVFTKEIASPGVLVRDVLIFAVKLVIDWAKDLVLIQAALIAVCLDLILMLAFKRRRSFFYRVLEIGERVDLWLNLYKSSQGAAHNPDGLFGESRAGDDTFLGEMEELVRRRPEPVVATGLPRQR